MNGQFILGDCLDIMPRLASGSVDMILCDLPYGTTKNKWDSVIPFEPLWREYWRLLRPNGRLLQCRKSIGWRIHGFGIKRTALIQ